jgi:hypothetical protein
VAVESSSLAVNRQVGNGGAQRLLRRGRYAVAVAEVKCGESSDKVVTECWKG